MKTLLNVHFFPWRILLTASFFVGCQNGDQISREGDTPHPVSGCQKILRNLENETSPSKVAIGIFKTNSECQWSVEQLYN